MTYDINATLERLEQNLKQLDSARKQVETTVQASEGLQNAVVFRIRVSTNLPFSRLTNHLMSLAIGRLCITI